MGGKERGGEGKENKRKGKMGGRGKNGRRKVVCFCVVVFLLRWWTPLRSFANVTSVGLPKLV